jgi:hypothetical protein
MIQQTGSTRESEALSNGFALADVPLEIAKKNAVRNVFADSIDGRIAGSVVDEDVLRVCALNGKVREVESRSLVEARNDDADRLVGSDSTGPDRRVRVRPAATAFPAG